MLDNVLHIGVQMLTFCSMFASGSGPLPPLGRIPLDGEAITVLVACALLVLERPRAADGLRTIGCGVQLDTPDIELVALCCEMVCWLRIIC